MKPTFSNRSISSLQSVYKNRRNRMQVRMFAWLEATARFYNLNNRAWDETEGACVYWPIKNDTVDSPGCVIGKDLSRKSVTKLKDYKIRNGIITILVEYEELDIEFPDWMLDFNTNFLARLQGFHDNPGNWDENGLSDYIGYYNYNNLVSDEQYRYNEFVRGFNSVSPIPVEDLPDTGWIDEWIDFESTAFESGVSAAHNFVDDPFAFEDNNF